MIEHYAQPITLVSARLIPMFLAVGLSPFAQYPASVRLFTIAILGVSVSSVFWQEWQVLNGYDWLIGLVSELVLGALMLLGFQLSYASILIIGRALDMQIGFAAAGIIDPVTHSSDPMLGHVLSLFLTLIIFVSNIHLKFITSLSDLFYVYPPGKWDFMFEYKAIINFFSAQVVVAILLLGPIIIALWLLDFFSGMVAKTMPQMNVYFVLLPLKIGIGIGLLSLFFSSMRPVFIEVLNNINNWFGGQWNSI